MVTNATHVKKKVLNQVIGIRDILSPAVSVELHYDTTCETYALSVLRAILIAEGTERYITGKWSKKSGKKK